MLDRQLETAPVGRLAAVRQWVLVPANQLLVLLLVLAAFPLLFELGRTPVQLWDEARLAMGAMEMSRGGNWLVVNYDGQPDHWSVKPPLLIWLQAISFKLLGYNALALRLPSALAGFGTVVVLYRFAAYRLGRPWAGFFGCLVLVTAGGYVRLHGIRTGDYDGLLAFWEVLVWISFFEYLETGRARHLYWLGGALVAAVLTKGVAGLLGGPALLLYALLRGKLLWLLRQWRLYAVAVVCAAVIASYYLAREHYDPGYIKLVRENELGGRFGTVVEGHTGPWSFYFDTLYAKDFAGWVWWWLLPMVLIWLQPSRLVRRAGGLLLLFVLGWLLVLSGSATKIDWYAIPTYPPLALLIGLGLDFLYHDVLAAYLPRLPRWGGWLLRGALVLLVFFLPYRATMNQLISQRQGDLGIDSDNSLARYLVETMRSRTWVSTPTLLYKGGYNAALAFYSKVFNDLEHRSIVVRYVGEHRQLQPGTTVLVCDPIYRTRLDSAFQLTTVYQDFPCETIMLGQKK